MGSYFESDFIETPENVQLERRLAGVGTRFIAGVLDVLWLSLVYIALLFLLWIVFQFTSGPGIDFFDTGFSWAIALWLLLAFAIYWGYFAMFELWTNGQSPGKKTMKIRVVRLDGGAILFTDVAIRSLLRAIDFLPFGYGIGGVVMFLTRRTQRLGDLAAGTVVVDESVRDYSANPKRKLHVNDAASLNMAGDDSVHASGLSDKEFKLLSNYWARRNELTIESRSQLLPKVMTPILKRLELYPPDMSVETLERYVDHLLHGSHLRAGSSYFARSSKSPFSTPPPMR